MDSMSNDPVDLRSDTVTRPSEGMRKAMFTAEVGDDVFGDDPTVIRLQNVAAERLGFADALFCPSATQANLVALMTHCARGEEVILGSHAHSYAYEAGGAAVAGSIHSHLIENAEDGTLSLAAIEAAIKPDDVHFPNTRLLALENTYSGRVLPLDYCAQAVALAQRRSLSTHLDGSRMFNAAAALQVSPEQVCKGFDSTTICLSKGLGAPIGALLLGQRDYIKRARRVRKMLGGGLRQVGVLAAAGLYALANNVGRLREDHANADRLARGLAEIGELRINGPHTNMLFVELAPQHTVPLAEHLKRQGVLVLPRNPMRLVTHLDVSGEGVDRAVAAFKQYFAGK
jgi:threonine aldolase